MEYSGKKRYTLCVIIIIRIPGIKRNVSDKNGEIFIMEYREKKFKRAGERNLNAGDKKKAVSAAKRQNDRKTTHVQGKNVSVQAETKTDRKKSLCPHFKTCGGCQYLDMPYEKQLEHKKKEVSDLLRPFCKV